MSEENKDPGIPKARILKSQIQKSQPPGSKIPKTKIKICGLSRMEDIEAVNVHARIIVDLLLITRRAKEIFLWTSLQN